MQKINKRWFFEKVNITDKSVSGLNEKKKRK